ncbi:MAG: FAD-dependent oxidoreductase [Gammaproteobacteria bacterium]
MARDVVVIGAGLLGITTAYFLRQHGYDVTVLERASEPALGASYGNGGYYQSTMPDPWNAPGALKMFAQAWMASITGKGDHSAFCARTSALPGLMSWGVRFLRNANRETFLSHLIKNKNLAQYTQTVVEDLVERETLDFARATDGGLVVFRKPEALESYGELAQWVSEHGARFELLDRDALLAKEPSLTEVGDELVGAVHFPDDSAGNSKIFCDQMAAIAQQNGVDFHYDTQVQKVSTTTEGVRVTTSEGEFAANALVIAAGVHSRALATPLGIDLPIAPAKGYSISVPMGGWSNRPRHVIADMDTHAGLNPMGDVLRVAGTAEFTGMRSGVSEERTRYLISLVRQLFPSFAKDVDPAQIDPWGGHRPLSADGIPMIGETPVKGVYVNTGHGGLGWTQAPGSSKALADLIAGDDSRFDLSGFSIARFR